MRNGRRRSVRRIRAAPRAARTRASSSPIAERLGQVVVRTGVERLDLVGLLRARGQHDDRDRRPAAEIADEVDAVAIGKSEVEDDEIRLARAGIDEPLRHRLGLEIPASPPSRAPCARSGGSGARPRPARRPAAAHSPVSAFDTAAGAGSSGISGGVPSGSVKVKTAPPSGGCRPRSCPWRFDDRTADGEPEAHARGRRFALAARELLEDRLFLALRAGPDRCRSRDTRLPCSRLSRESG